MCRFPASGSSWKSLAHGGVDHTIRHSPIKKVSKVAVTLVSVLAGSAIRCRFVDRFVKLKVLSRVSRQRFSPHGTPLPSVGSRQVRFPDVTGRIEVLRLPVTHPWSLICFASGVHATLLGSCLAACACAPRGLEVAIRPGSIFNRRPDCRFILRGRERDLPGFQAIHPVPLPRSRTPAKSTIPRLLTVSSMLPTRTTEKASAY